MDAFPAQRAQLAAMRLSEGKESLRRDTIMCSQDQWGISESEFLERENLVSDAGHSQATPTHLLSNAPHVRKQRTSRRRESEMGSGYARPQVYTDLVRRVREIYSEADPLRWKCARRTNAGGVWTQN